MLQEKQAMEIRNVWIRAADPSSILPECSHLVVSYSDWPSVPELHPYTVPPVFPWGRSRWWMEESRPPLHPSLLILFLLFKKRDSLGEWNPFVCHNKLLCSLVSRRVLFISDKISTSSVCSTLFVFWQASFKQALLPQRDQWLNLQSKNEALQLLVWP